VQLLAPRSVGGYEGQLDWYRRVGDEEGLRALQAQLANTTLEVAQRKAAYQRAKNDEEEAEHEKARRALLLRLEATEGKLPRAETSPRARRTHAALWLLRGLQHADATDEARQAFDAFSRARALWPDLSSARLSEVALTLALDEASAAHPPLAARWAKERGSGNPDWFVEDLVRANDAPALLALQNSAALTALATERRAQLGGARAGVDPEVQRVSGSLVDWSLGRLLEDDRLTAAGVQHARWPVVQLSAAVTSVLFPYATGAQRGSRAVKEIAAWGIAKRAAP
jgi:hypothetical protein